MTADEFLADWISKHIKIGTPETDTARLKEEVLFAASQNEINDSALMAAAGENLEDYLVASMRKAAERAQIGEARFQQQE